MAAGREDRMNQCIFVGRLTGDPEIWIAENEARTVIGKMYIAVDRKVKKIWKRKRIFLGASALESLRSLQRNI